jgi:tripartite-type tricarboxylate transporter receptor subunit TctC
MIWSVPANSRIMNIQDLINLSRTREVFAAVTSKWVAQHTSVELLNLQAGVNITPVLHKSAPLAGTSLLSESVDVLVDTVSTSSGYAKSGKSRVIAVSTARRSAQWPQVPTIGETVPGYVLAPWNAMFANRGMPREIIAQINRDVNDILSDRSVPNTIFESVQGGSAEKLAQQIERDRASFARLVKKFNLQPE